MTMEVKANEYGAYTVYVVQVDHSIQYVFVTAEAAIQFQHRHPEWKVTITPTMLRM